MKLVKKIIKKIYHLIWFLSIFFLFSSPVHAIVNIDGAAFVQAPQADFSDNTNGSLTSVGTTFTNGYWVSNDIYLNGANTNGANITFTSNTPFVAGFTYSLSILLGMSTGRAKPSDYRLCIAENIANAKTRFSDGWTCTNAYVVIPMDGISTFDINDSLSLQFTILTYVFTADTTSPTVSLVYQGLNTAGGSPQVFGGYYLETIGQPINGITSQDIQNVINNSGLATSSSISQVQSGINNARQDLNHISADLAEIESNQRQNTQDILDNNDANADAIINNNNSNRNQIIQNQDENTNKEINSQRVCKVIDKNSVISNNKTLTSSNGSVINSNINLGVTNYFRVSSTSELTLLHKNNVQQSIACFYNINKSFISCLSQRDLSEGVIPIPNDASYFRATINSDSDLPTWQICSDGNQALDDSINSLNDNIINDDAPDIDLNLNESSDTPISDLLTMPLTILNTLITNLSDTCSNYTIPFFFSTTVTFPCFTLSDYLGSTVTNYIDLFICLYMCYNIAMLCISVFDDITSLNDIFNSLYTPRHAYTGYKPKHGGGD